MAARPLESEAIASIAKVCQNSMLSTVSCSNSGQSARVMRNGTRRHHKTPSNTGKPNHMLSARKLKGGKPLTPNFMMGQFKPHTSVKAKRVQSCRGVSVGRADMASLLKSSHDLS